MKIHLFLLIFVSIFIAGCVIEEGDNYPPLEPPSYPTNTYCACGDRRLTLSWNPVSEASQYNMYMATFSGVSTTNYQEMRTVDSTLYTWTDLTNGRSYYFVMTSLNNAGEGDHCPEFCGTPLDPFTEVNEEWIGSGDGHFGSSVAISGDYAVVGAFMESGGGVDFRGSAYIFHHTGNGIWDNGYHLTMDVPQHWCEYGRSVSIDNNYVVVGAPKVDSLLGAAYIYHRTGANEWDGGTKLVAPYQEADDHFGYSVSISRDYVAVTLGWDPRAYVFHRIGTNIWDAGTELLAPENHFGHTLAISGDYIVLSSPDAAFVFHRIGTNTWDSGIKLVAPDDGDAFGGPVAIDGDYIVVGAAGQDLGGTDRGAVYVFYRSGTNSWNAATKLTDSDGGDWDGFGEYLAISGEFLIVGTRLRETLFVYRHSGSNWDLVNKITGYGGVALDGYYAITRAPVRNVYALYAFPR